MKRLRVIPNEEYLAPVLSARYSLWVLFYGYPSQYGLWVAAIEIYGDLLSGNFCREKLPVHHLPAILRGAGVYKIPRVDATSH